MSRYDTDALHDRLCTEYGTRLEDGPCVACRGWVDDHEPHDSGEILCQTCEDSENFCEECRGELLYVIDEDDTLCPECGQCAHDAGVPATEWFAEPTGEWVAKFIGRVRDAMRLADLALSEAKRPSAGVAAVREHAITAQLDLNHALNLLAAIEKRRTA